MNGHVYLGVPDVLQVVLVHVAAGDHADHEQVSVDHHQMPEPHRAKETSNRRGKKWVNIRDDGIQSTVGNVDNGLLLQYLFVCVYG